MPAAADAAAIAAKNRLIDQFRNFNDRLSNVERLAAGDMPAAVEVKPFSFKPPNHLYMFVVILVLALLTLHFCNNHVYHTFICKSPVYGFISMQQCPQEKFLHTLKWNSYILLGSMIAVYIPMFFYSMKR
jgi:hypothetical protein